MRCLSFVQPWAALITIGAKVYETRGWGTTYRGPLAIHATQAFPLAARSIADEPEFFQVLHARRLWPDDLPRGAVVGIVDLVQCHQMVRAGVVDGIALCKLEQAFGDFRPPRFAWQLANPRMLRDPIPARGMQGLWDWAQPPNLEELLTLQTPGERPA